MVQLPDIVRRVWEAVGDRGAAANVEVALELSEGLPPVMGDAAQIQQVFLNLSVNALPRRWARLGRSPCGRASSRTDI